MITGDDVRRQMEREVAGSESAEAQHARLGVDADSIAKVLLTAKASRDEVVCIIGGICIGLEAAKATKSESDDFLERVERDKFIESIEPEAQGFA